jgi:hypothetical protein
MSYKVALFAFPESVSRDKIVEAFESTVDVLSADLEMEGAHLALKAIDGVTFVEVLATGRPRGSGASRGTAMDTLSCDDPVAFLGYDDQNGVFVFDYADPAKRDWLFLVSDGPFIGGDVERVAGEFPQKGFTGEDLNAILEKAEEDCSEAEQAAVAEYLNAIEIGLKEKFGWTSGRSFLDVCHEETAIPLSGDRRAAPIPDGAQGLFAFWPTDEDFHTAKLPIRVY